MSVSADWCRIGTIITKGDYLVKKLISPLDLSTAEIDQLLALADRIIDDPAAYAHKCDGKILATVF